MSQENEGFKRIAPIITCNKKSEIKGLEIPPLKYICKAKAQTSSKSSMNKFLSLTLFFLRECKLLKLNNPRKNITKNIRFFGKEIFKKTSTIIMVVICANIAIARKMRSC